MSPSWSAYLVTSSLLVLTVALVSLSPMGFDIAGLILSACFMVVLFYIIAAPAITFKPASRLFEFFARHGDYAGLWLVVPALFAGLMTSMVPAPPSAH